MFCSGVKGREGKSDSSGPTNNRVSGPHRVLGVFLVCRYFGNNNKSNLTVIDVIKSNIMFGKLTEPKIG